MVTTAEIFQPALIIIAGPNGSGKTTLTEQVIRHQWVDGCEYINPDAIAKNDFGDWNSPEAVLNAANLATSRREKCLDDGRNLAFETVLSTPDKVDFVLRAKERGFFVRLFFVGTNHPGINASRVTQRVMEGGHDVPIPKIISRYTKSIANCAALVGVVDRCYIYDNSIEGCEPRLMFRAIDGAMAKIYGEINPWAQGVVQALAQPADFQQPKDI